MPRRKAISAETLKAQIAMWENRAMVVQGNYSLSQFQRAIAVSKIQETIDSLEKQLEEISWFLKSGIVQ